MRWISVAMIMLLLCALPSCVNVTTERTPEGGYERDSEVKVNTYGWNFLAASLHILFFPFKLLWHAVKIVL
jgi:hypothetical protein